MLKVLPLLRVFAMMVVAGAIARGQGAARDNAIAGTVVDARTGKPIGAVLVSISEGPNTPPLESSPGLHGRAQILTGADGRFLFRDLTSGTFTITAIKNGYAEGASGRRRIGSTAAPVPSGDAQSPPEITVRMWKLGAITGTVVDESGEPVVGVQLRALVRSRSAENRRFVVTGRPASTDDRGIYRFSGLVPGDYLVVASAPTTSSSVSVFETVAHTGRVNGPVSPPPGTPTGIQVGDGFVGIGRGGAIPPPPIAGHLFVYPPTFHPAALDPGQARVITLSSGEEIESINLQLQPVPTARVAGRLEGPDLHGGEYVRLSRPAWQDLTPDLDQDAPSAMADSTDRFVLPAVPAGDYTVRTTTEEGSTRYFAATPLTVAGPEVEVTAVLRPLLRATFRYEFDGETEKPKLPVGVFSPLLLQRVDGASGPRSISGAFDASGQFEKSGGRFQLNGFEPGKYRVVVRDSPAGWMFKSAMLNGVDVSETPFDLTRDSEEIVLTFTNRWSGISGVVHGAEAETNAAIVLVFPTNSQSWESCPRRCRGASTNQQGKFGFGSLAPGDYYVVAVPEDQSDGWRDAKTLDSLARVATRVTILDGEHKTIDLEMRQVPQ